MNFRNGNRKLGKDTLIFNMTSATDCPSFQLNMCQMFDTSRCYAYRAENQFPNVLAFRRKQAQSWRQSNPETIVIAILDSIRRKQTPIHFIRFSESGDFRSQVDVDKMSHIASMLPWLTFYGYSSRQDLSFKSVPENMTVNGSGFMIHNQFDAVHEYTGKHIKCLGNCRECNTCKGRRGVKIENLLH